MSEKVRFYTNPPRDVQWPFILFNIRNHSTEIARYKLKTAKWMKHCLIDSAVDKWFFIDRLNDYPPNYLKEYAKIAKKLTRQFPEAWITIPDYPDDYEHKLCWRNGKTNVDLTLENIERFICIDGVNWLPVLQSEYLNFESFREMCRQVRQKYNPVRLGIGTVCKTQNLKFIQNCIRHARQMFPNAWLHAFGPTLKAVNLIQHEVNSFDSTAYFYKPSGELLGPMKCTQKERRSYFEHWITKLQRITSIPTLLPYMQEVSA
jgi:hypothetical protein